MAAPGTVYLSYADTAEKAGEIIIDNLGGSVEYARKYGIGWIGKTLPAGTGTGRRKKYDYIKWMLPGFMLIVR